MTMPLFSGGKIISIGFAIGFIFNGADEGAVLLERIARI